MTCDSWGRSDRHLVYICGDVCNLIQGLLQHKNCTSQSPKLTFNHIRHWVIFWAMFWKKVLSNTVYITDFCFHFVDI